MQNLPIQSISNQSFSTTLNNEVYNFTIKTGRGITSVDISHNGQEVISGVRALPFTPLLPYKYLENGGNFAFLTSNFQLPIYPRFNVTQVLGYFTADELSGFRVSNLLFNPNAALPLRYQPQGYSLAP